MSLRINFVGQIQMLNKADVVCAIEYRFCKLETILTDQSVEACSDAVDNLHFVLSTLACNLVSVVAIESEIVSEVKVVLSEGMCL